MNESKKKMRVYKGRINEWRKEKDCGLLRTRNER